MRLKATWAALVLVSACATAPSIAPPPAAAVRAPSNALAELVGRAGQADAPSETEIVRGFGGPDIARRDGVGAALTYRFETCGLLLLFAADERNVMRLREARASARGAGEAAPSLEQCVTGARAP